MNFLKLALPILGFILIVLFVAVVEREPSGLVWSVDVSPEQDRKSVV